MTKKASQPHHFSRPALISFAVLALALVSHVPARAQQIVGAITGTPRDSTGGRPESLCG